LADDHIQHLSSLTQNELGILLAACAVIGGMIHQKAVNREKLIDYLLEVGADLSPDERQSPYAHTVSAIVQILEHTQFPDNRGNEVGH
jgi:hypothetical protein